MAVDEKICFIGGGRMAEALIKGIIQAGIIPANHISVVDPDPARRHVLADLFNVSALEDADTVWEECKIIILAVKPQIIPEVLEDYRNQVNKSHLIISIAAGVPLAVLEGKLAGSGARIIRVMPNTPAIVLEGASALSPSARATDEDVELAKMIFDAVGKCVVLNENNLDAVTGLSGSGPAYVFSFIEALVDAGIKEGLTKPVAETLVLQTIVGSVKLAMESGEHPAQLRAMVTSPGGTTIAGLHELERAGFQGIVMDAVGKATERSRELGSMSLSRKIID